MADTDIDGDDVEELPEDASAGGSIAGGGVDSVTPQSEVSGDDPAGLEPVGAGSAVAGASSGDEDGGAGGVGDWDPASAGGGGGEVY